MNADALAERVRAVVERSRDDLVRVSHDLHAHPEIRWEEHRSAALLCAEAERAGFSVEREAGGLTTAFLARRGAGAVTVGVFAEYDALPGLGHACGHNVIAAAALGAATALAEVADELGLTVVLVGSPAEEGGGGKILLQEAGVLDDLDLALMVHPGPDDVIAAVPRAVAHADVHYEGIGAHAAAYPEEGVNAADAFTVAQIAIGLLRQQLPDHARVHGIVTEAGTAPNAIPERASGHWYVRAADLSELDVLVRRVHACFAAGALATGCTLSFRETSPRYSQFRTDPALSAAFARRAAARGRTMAEGGPAGMHTASTDMGNVSLRTRAIHPYLSIDSGGVSNHQAAFHDAAATPAADRTIVDGAIILAQAVVDVVCAEQGVGGDDSAGESRGDAHAGH